ncbi:unnamed protein product, partial [Rotaria sp. Silwood2]
MAANISIDNDDSIFVSSTNNYTSQNPQTITTTLQQDSSSSGPVDAAIISIESDNSIFVSSTNNCTSQNPQTITTTLQQDLSSSGLVDATFISIDSDNSIFVSSTNNYTSQNPQPIITTLQHDSSSLDSMKLKNDIGHYVKDRLTLSDEVRYLLLTQHFVPGEKFKWPFVERNINNTIERRFLRPNHLSNNKPWLVYSPSKAGLYCLPCVLFAKPTGNNQLGCFVLSPCQEYSRLLGADGLISRHKTNNYHKDSIINTERFISVYEGKCDGVDDLLLNKQKIEKIENRKRLIPIIKTIILCGQNNISLRGHRDDGDLSMESIVHGEGNFRSLLRFRIDAGDSTLASHLSAASKAATYISKTTQNELIEICGNFIREHIINEIKHAKFFTVIGDETTDVSNIEQFTFCLRYVFEDKVQEKFISFLPAEDRTGEGLARLILEELTNLGLDPNFMVGQAYDGCSAMSGQFNGTQITAMRVTGRQTYRSNAPAQTPEDYYRINLFIPMLDHFIVSLSNRFTAHKWMAYKVSVLIPSMIEKKSFNDLKESITFYEAYLPSPSSIQEEFQLYQRKWLNEAPADRPNNAIDAYIKCNGIFFPNIKVLLQIYATLPVTTATGERSFSTLKLVKSYLRSTMSESRLNGLAM